MEFKLARGFLAALVCPTGARHRVGGGEEECHTHSTPPQRPGQVPSGHLGETQVRVVRSEGISPPVGGLKEA